MMPSPYILLLIPAIGITLWCAMLTVLSYLSGWRKLAAGYTHREPFPGETWRFQSGELRWLGIKNCLIIGADPRGLYLSMMLLFRFWHPPLLIPWGSIQVQNKKKLFNEGVEFRLGPGTGVPFWVWTTTANKIKTAAGAAFPG